MRTGIPYKSADFTLLKEPKNLRIDNLRTLKIGTPQPIIRCVAKLVARLLATAALGRIQTSLKNTKWTT
jgi:hypothetical protein